MMWVASINFTTRKDYEADEKGLVGYYLFEMKLEGEGAKGLSETLRADCLLKITRETAFLGCDRS